MTTPKQDDLIRLGKELEEARIQTGLSASEVANAAGCSTAYVRTIERGVNPKTQTASRPSAQILRGLAHAVGHDPREWFVLAGYPADQADAAPPPVRGGVAHYMSQLNEAVKTLQKRSPSPFMHEQAVQMLRTLTNQFVQAANGSVKVSADKEPQLTQVAVNSCQAHLRAVSYHDEEWWQSASGDAYLEHHADLRERGVEVTRIFLIASERVALLTKTLEKHIELGMHAYVLDVENVEEPRDFVIYDDTLLREASSLGLDDPDRKTAEFTDDPARIEGALIEFEELRTAAVAFGGSAEKVLARSSVL